ncbi:MAG: hypothetical protein RMM08_00285 [Armatimonadota bacterium]|nr:hypothetical protein [bacterium]MDW8319772.1 hypothetical protein [Armatimonadota bacterium]
MIPVRERFVVDESGQPIAVLLDIEVYRQLLEAVEELESLQAYDEAKASGEVPVPLEEAIASIEKERS